jgi:hypothetical protein
MPFYEVKVAVDTGDCKCFRLAIRPPHFDGVHLLAVAEEDVRPAVAVVVDDGDSGAGL